MTFAAGDKPTANDFTQLSTKKVSSTAAATGVTTTETKDASGDLTFTAVSGYTYTVAYLAIGRGGAAGHSMDVNIRDGSAASPTSASTKLVGITVNLPGVTLTEPVSIFKPLACPGDITAGTHTIAVFYVRNANGTTTNVVQLENAGSSRTLSVTGAITA